MAGTLNGMTLPPHEWVVRRMFLFAALMLFISACGSIDYDINEKNFFAPASKKKDIGVVHFHFGDSSTPYTIHARRVRGGYAILSSIYETDEGSDIHITAARTKEQAYFLGVQGKLQF
jgi:hypothetical protein